MATFGRMAVSRLLRLRNGIVPQLKTGVRNSSATTHASWQQYGVPGGNLPFDISNRYKLTLYFTLYYAIGFNLPFVVVIHQYLKNQ